MRLMAPLGCFDMSQQDKSGPAFPGFQYTEGHGPWRRQTPDGPAEYHEPGMSLRDYFAAKAMQAALTHQASGDLGEWMTRSAELAYEAADAMLAARSKA